MEFKHLDGQIVKEVDGEAVGVIKYRHIDDQTIDAYSTFVDDSQRGQGLARKLVDELVAKAADEGLKIKPTCSYVVNLFDKEPETYDHINATN